MVNEPSTGSDARPLKQAEAVDRLARAGGKRVIICCDGTSNHPNSSTPTNIVKIARGLKSRADRDIEQIIYYHRGVGTDGFLDSITGGAFGWGLQRNVEDAYRFLVHNYRPGDQVCLFGFSRGAFTVRSVAGLIRQCSILKSENAHLIKEGYDNYRDPAVSPDDELSSGWRATNSHLMPHIEFLGVFDTVGAMGVPANRFIGALKFWTSGFWKGLLSGSSRVKTGEPRPYGRTKNWSKGKSRHGFHDMRLSRWVRNAFHALAIDEMRPVFTPAIWDSELKRLPEPPSDGKWDGVLAADTTGLTDEHQTVVQAWFPGAHSDVGGNSKVHNSSLALKWMAEAAQKNSGVEFEDHFWQQIEKDIQVCGKLSASPPGVWKSVGWQQRDMSGNEGRTECIHPSAYAREEDANADYEIKNPGHENLGPAPVATENVGSALAHAEAITADVATADDSIDRAA